MNAQLPVTLCARQPIFDSNLDVFAYELLFREGNDEHADIVNGDIATSQVLLNAFTERPFENLLEGKKGFIKFPKKLLSAPPPVCESQIVVEILEDIDVTASLIDNLKQLKAAGFKIAFNRKVQDEEYPELLRLVDIIKLDVSPDNSEILRQEIDTLTKYHCAFLAKKIEDLAELRACQKLGFSLFQGFFLSKPNTLKGKTVRPDQRAVMRLLRVLQGSEAGFKEIEAVIATSSELTYKLLQLINSAAFGFDHPVTSIHTALTLMGLEKIRSWGSLLALANNSDKPKVLCTNALIRGEMCRRLINASPTTDLNGNNLFTVGLLSTMDLFLDLPMQEITQILKLPGWLAGALLERNGDIGIILNTAIAYESADFEGVYWDGLHDMGLESMDVQHAYHDSIIWTSKVMDQFS